MPLCTGGRFVTSRMTALISRQMTAKAAHTSQLLCSVGGGGKELACSKQQGTMRAATAAVCRRQKCRDEALFQVLQTHKLAGWLAACT